MACIQPMSTYNMCRNMIMALIIINNGKANKRRQKVAATMKGNIERNDENNMAKASK